MPKRTENTFPQKLAHRQHSSTTTVAGRQRRRGRPPAGHWAEQARSTHTLLRAVQPPIGLRFCPNPQRGGALKPDARGRKPGQRAMCVIPFTGMSRTEKPIETDSRLLATVGWGETGMRGDRKRVQGSSGDDTCWKRAVVTVARPCEHQSH